jgi:hypothetical protein
MQPTARLNTDYEQRICVIESQGSFIHEILNIPLIENAVNTHDKVSLIGSQDFIVNTFSIMSEYCNKIPLGKIICFPLEPPKRLWSLSQLKFELQALSLCGDVKEILLLSVSPFTSIAVVLDSLRRKLRRRNFSTISAVYHGYLANLLPRKKRPDPYLYRKGFRIFIHPFRYILQPKFTLPLSKTKFGRINYLVLSSHILQNLIDSCHKYDNFKLMKLEIMKFDTGRLEIKENGKINVLIIGRSPSSELNLLLEMLRFQEGLRVKLYVDKGVERHIFIENRQFLEFVNLENRLTIVEVSRKAHILLMLRNTDESDFRLSGAMLEAISLSRPILLPEWIRKVKIDNKFNFPSEFYSSTPQLAGILSDHNRLIQLVSENSALTHSKEVSR